MPGSSVRTTLLIFAVVLAWVLVSVIPLMLFSSWSTRGSVGEMFGLTDSVFSAMALLGVIYTLLLQREDIRLQRQEQKAQLEELKRTAHAQERAQAALQDQVNALNMAARLSALSAALSHYDNKIVRGEGMERQYAKEEAEKAVEEIKELLERM